MGIRKLENIYFGVFHFAVHVVSVICGRDLQRQSFVKTHLSHEFTPKLFRTIDPLTDMWCQRAVSYTRGFAHR